MTAKHECTSFLCNILSTIIIIDFNSGHLRSCSDPRPASRTPLTGFSDPKNRVFGTVHLPNSTASHPAPTRGSHVPSSQSDFMSPSTAASLGQSFPSRVAQLCRFFGSIEDRGSQSLV